MEKSMKRSKKATLGTLISLIIALLLAGVTFKILSDIWGKTVGDDTRETYTKMIEKMKELSAETAGSRRSVISQIDAPTAILGFSKGKKDLLLSVSLGQRNVLHFAFEKPAQCKEDSCVCVCITPTTKEQAYSSLPVTLKCEQPLSCTKGEAFGNLDMYPHPQGIDVEVGHGNVPVAVTPLVENGFFLYRGHIDEVSLFGSELIIRPAPFAKGTFSMYLERVTDAVAVCTQLQAGSCIANRAKEPEALVS